MVHVREAGNRSSSGTITGALRALGFKAEQFTTGKWNVHTGSVEADGVWYFYNGNDFLGATSLTGPVCRFFLTLELVAAYTGDPDCEYYNSTKR